MQYSDEFKKKVLSILGDSEEMRQRLDEGQEFVGRILDNSRYGGVKGEACETVNVHMYREAKRRMAIDKLYDEWIELYQNQHQGKHR